MSSITATAATAAATALEGRQIRHAQSGERRALKAQQKKRTLEISNLLRDVDKLKQKAFLALQALHPLQETTKIPPPMQNANGWDDLVNRYSK